jgi:hypothetical protein
MRVKQIINKKECLECLFTEINILTECRHPNVVKILDASFDGTIIKEQKVTLGDLGSEKLLQASESLKDQEAYERIDEYDLDDPLHQDN